MYSISDRTGKVIAYTVYSKNENLLGAKQADKGNWEIGGMIVLPPVQSVESLEGLSNIPKEFKDKLDKAKAQNDKYSGGLTVEALTYQGREGEIYYRIKRSDTGQILVESRPYSYVGEKFVIYNIYRKDGLYDIENENGKIGYAVSSIANVDIPLSESDLNTIKNKKGEIKLIEIMLGYIAHVYYKDNSIDTYYAQTKFITLSSNPEERKQQLEYFKGELIKNLRASGQDARANKIEKGEIEINFALEYFKGVIIEGLKILGRNELAGKVERGEIQIDFITDPAEKGLYKHVIKTEQKTGRIIEEKILVRLENIFEGS